MDVELQILQHLKRSPAPTVAIIDEYCDAYNDLFPEVRSYECFKYLHQGIISPIKRKSLPEIAKVVGINSYQSLHPASSQLALVSQPIKRKKTDLNPRSIKRPKNHSSN